MRKAVVTALFLAACGTTPVRPSGFDPSKGTATLALGPAADADRTTFTRGAALVSLRDAAGAELLAGTSRQCTAAPVELNPGRYAVVVERCATGCAKAPAQFAFTLDVRPGHRYRFELDKPLVSLQLLVSEWEAFLIDETADTSTPVGKSVERCD